MKSSRSAWLTATAIVGVLSATGALAATGSGAVYDVIIEHGTVFDGTGSPGQSTDIGVIAGRIAALGDLHGVAARQRIDASHLYVAPGFINVHDHSTPEGLPTALNMLTQGETTAILNPDGYGEPDLAKQLTDLAKPGMALNIGAYSGFNAIWEETVGANDVRPTPAQIAAMRGHLEKDLEQGAWGVSAGLDYKPAYYASADEVVSVVSAASKWRTNFPNHDRLRSETGYSSRLGVAETIAIASAAGLSPEITHIKAQGREQGRAAEILDQMHQATANGHFSTGDVYPYTAGMTGLFSFTVPGWAQEGGIDEMLKRFKNPDLRAKIVANAEGALDARFGGPKGVYLPMSRRQLVDVAKAEGVSSGEALLRVMEKGEFVGVFTFGSEDDVRTFLRDPAVSITCDCGADLETRTHPRLYGTYPRILGRYVRDEHVLSWAEAIRKLTGLPASSLGMVDRGFIAPGMAADIAIFDPATVIDHATYENPTALSDGIRFVLVNGTVELSDGKPTGAKAGAVLLRSEHMPTRPMNVAGHGASSLASVPLRSKTGQPAKLSLDIAQTVDGKAVGSVTLTDENNHVLLSARALGPLQLGDRWMSVTGWAASPAGQSFTLIIDRGNPRQPGKGAIVLETGSGERYSGEIAE
ncbi:amidohydrolase family protein [Novosphingobium sp. FKTRR1]|uniref:N-acyl-D-amino-acid deacylase family protein n=1 Tax=Novosphingobium sp. FKTRR1 TaxID=2879118 RepID=UPI001CF01B0B|nr:amidohydrolase family protein [Novosphingobium sp. FKTRR1]